MGLYRFLPCSPLDGNEAGDVAVDESSIPKGFGIAYVQLDNSLDKFLKARENNPYLRDRRPELYETLTAKGAD